MLADSNPNPLKFIAGRLSSELKAYTRTPAKQSQPDNG